MVICGECCGLHIVGAERIDEQWQAYLRRPTDTERAWARTDPKVKAILDAFQLADMEARMSRPKSKAKALGRVKDGDKLSLKAFGPGYRGPR